MPLPGSTSVSGRHLAETTFFFDREKVDRAAKFEQSVGMRTLFVILTIAFAAGAVFAADVRDLGVPAGWKASEYDNRGYDFLNKHDYQNARRYFDAAIRTDPSLWTAYYNRATTFCQQKKWATALQDLNSTIRLKPSFLDASLARTEVNLHLGNYSAALSELSELGELTWRLRSAGQYSFVLNGRAWLRATCPDASIRNAQLALADAKRLASWRSGSTPDTSIPSRRLTPKVAILIRPCVTNSKPLL